MGGEGQDVETREPIDDNVSEEGIKRLIAERSRNGVRCRVVKENGKRFLVCVSPAL